MRGCALSAPAAAQEPQLETVDAVDADALAAVDAAQDDVEQLRTELGELRQLLIAQARLVQSQQRNIQQLETAVGQSVVQTSAAAASAAAAQEAAAAAVATPAAPGAAASGGAARSSGPAILGGGAGARSQVLESVMEEEARANLLLQQAPLGDRRLLGLFDARYHSTAWGASPKDFRVLPKRIFLVRHAESEGNVDNIAYTYLPDPRVPLTARGWQQAMSAGDRLKACMDEASGEEPSKLFFYTSPYLRSRQTYEGLAMAFNPDQVQGVQEEVQLREQDFGNFQDAEGKKREKAERLRFGRFFYRFPNGESGADVYDRMTIFEDHLVRDINAGRFAGNTSLVLVTHGLALRIFLMRWFHWTVDQFMSVFNPPNAEPLMLERVPDGYEARQGGPVAWIHTKALYRLSDGSREIIKGCTEEMCQTSWAPRGINPLDPADRLLLPDP
ncbi:phosphoglycerate mutase [Micractinium conductrix]|uniref:Phosphoglycerate mutase n=1 Tax=Micractinium conductrix TaxID=554055 RepID=A0A2P6V758_9CHLO|nr:phosphoglycerate mutase [Micractinium conductrix]|eukprot:PSC69919.1 phosphoglycerate mutase [Micractinium conductrix]